LARHRCRLPDGDLRPHHVFPALERGLGQVFGCALSHSRSLYRSVYEGHTVVVVEHHPDVYAEADYLIDIGPESGTDGGQLVAAGTLEEVKKSKVSRTARFL
jgi:hypothetical protein